MIRNSFIFLDRIKERSEKSIWRQGITDWNQFLFADEIKGISQKRKVYYQRQLSKAQSELYSQNARYFKNRLPSNQTWRLYEYFKGEAAFLDIEASGITKDDHITVIGLFDGIKTKTMIKDVNLDIDALRKELLAYKMIITFNGASFDIPFIEKRYPYLIPDVPHIDLKHLCNMAGLSGGLKEIEKELGIRRDNEIVQRMYGGDPYRLWRMHKASGDDHYLKLLVEYNEEDIINLKAIADHCYSVMKRRCEDEFRSAEKKPGDNNSFEAE